MVVAGVHGVGKTQAANTIASMVCLRDVWVHDAGGALRRAAAILSGELMDTACLSEATRLFMKTFYYGVRRSTGVNSLMRMACTQLLRLHGAVVVAGCYDDDERGSLIDAGAFQLEIGPGFSVDARTGAPDQRISVDALPSKSELWEAAMKWQMWMERAAEAKGIVSTDRPATYNTLSP